VGGDQNIRRVLMNDIDHALPKSGQIIGVAADIQGDWIVGRTVGLGDALFVVVLLHKAVEVRL
jgi:hypothetical protein